MSNVIEFPLEQLACCGKCGSPDFNMLMDHSFRCAECGESPLDFAWVFIEWDGDTPTIKDL